MPIAHVLDQKLIMLSRSEAGHGLECIRQTPGEAPESAGTGAIRIWIVDDNEGYRVSLADLLAGETGFECSGMFPSAEAVLEALSRESPPDVLLLDIDMGGMSGLDAIRPIRLRAATTRILMLTAFFDTHRQSRALREGAADFLLKSYSMEKIFRRIRVAREQPVVELPPLACGHEPENGRIEPGGRTAGSEFRPAPRGSAADRLVRRVGFLRTLLGFGN